MAGKGFRLQWQPTSVGGVISQSMSVWTQVVNGSVRLNHVFIKSTKSDTQFTFKITSPTGNVIYHRDNITNELSEEKQLIMRGLYILTIQNVTNAEGTQVDDYFEGEFMFEDRKDK